MTNNCSFVFKNKMLHRVVILAFIFSLFVLTVHVFAVEKADPCRSRILPFIEVERIREKEDPPPRLHSIVPIVEIFEDPEVENAPGIDPDRYRGKTPAIIAGEALSLYKSVSIAMKRNPLIKIARENVVQARAKYDEIRSNKNLKADFTGASQLQGPNQVLSLPPPINRTIKFSREYSHFGRLSLKYLITSFGKVDYPLAAQFIKIKSEIDNLDREKINLAYNVKDAFFQILKTDEYVESSNDYVNQAADHLKQAKVLYKQGIVSRFDVLRAELALSEARQSLIKAKLGRTLARSAFLTYLNYNQRFPFKLQPPPPIAVETGVNLASLQQMALKNRHDVKALKKNIQASKFLIKAAKANAYPDIQFSANYDRQTGTIIINEENWAIGIQLRIPILDGGETDAKVKEAKSVMRALDFSLNGMESQVRLEVEKAWLEMKQARQVLKTNLKDLETSKEGYRMARIRYAHGMSTSLEMEDALRTVNRSRNNVINAQYDYNVAFAALERAVGVNVPGRRIINPGGKKRYE